MEFNIAEKKTVTDLRYLKGIGPKRSQVFEKIGIRTIQDLFYLFPRRYEDRSRFCKIRDIQPGLSISVRGEILSSRIIPVRRRPILNIMAGDETGTIQAVWFNQVYLKKDLAPGKSIILFGKADFYKGKFQFISPEFEIVEDDDEASIHTGRITPIYPLTEGLFQRSLRKIMWQLVQKHLPGAIREYLPASFRSEHQYMKLSDAVCEMHFPKDAASQEEAQRRLTFDELLVFQLTMLKRRERLRNEMRALPMANAEAFAKEFAHSLPFNLTPGQENAVNRLCHKLKSDAPMNLLLQGDVGCGKTAVAATALYIASKNNFQGAMLAPTELLAEQHFASLAPYFDKAAISAGLLTASTLPQKRARLLSELRHNNLSVLIGTHALLQEEVQFSKLGLVIIDEQHKFGVHQRCQLLQQTPRPHQLIMTATPIPRTLALTVYGDLEVVSIRDMPAGRKPVSTYWITRKKQEELLTRVREKIEGGEQAYFIFPIIAETEKSDLLAAEKEYARLKSGLFKNVPMGLVHGRLSSDERAQTMKRFQTGAIKILIATSVVEVGVDNPNASIMIIENSERFGLSQLHQMRGRVGRGSRPSSCFLFGEPKTLEGKKRLTIMTRLQDGFEIAEEDLKLRGPGEFFGTRQSGAALFRLADPVRDYDLFVNARACAEDLIQNDKIDAPEWAALNEHMRRLTIHY